MSQPGLPSHLKAFGGETNGNLPFCPSVLYMNLEVVNKSFNWSWLVGLDDTNIVAVKIHVRILDRELIGGNQQETSGTVDGVELGGRVFVLVHVA